MRNKGFTLIETILAMVILSSGLLLLANSLGGSLLFVRKAQHATEISALLERKMAEIEIEYSGKSLDSIPEEKEDDFGSENANYSWKMESKNFEVPDISATLTAKEGGADDMSLTLMKTLTQHLSKTIKEVKVTVIFKGGKKPITASATQYFVDYDKDITVPGGASQ